jgi:hypothetical protein
MGRMLFGQVKVSHHLILNHYQKALPIVWAGLNYYPIIRSVPTCQAMLRSDVPLDVEKREAGVAD